MLLLISDRKELRDSLASALMQRGVFAFRIPLESAAYVCRRKDTGGILLDTYARGGELRGLFAALRSASPSMPIALLAPKEQSVDLLADAILRESEVDPLADAVLDFYRCTCGWSTEGFSSYALSMGRGAEDCFYYGYRLAISPLEHRMLCCLFYRFPQYTSAEDLLELCCDGEGMSIRNVAVHIGRINREAERIARVPLVTNRYGVGYRLREEIFAMRESAQREGDTECT
jgi:DNA-binding response OmpR family regulator